MIIPPLGPNSLANAANVKRRTHTYIFKWISHNFLLSNITVISIQIFV